MNQNLKKYSVKHNILYCCTYSWPLPLSLHINFKLINLLLIILLLISVTTRNEKTFELYTSSLHFNNYSDIALIYFCFICSCTIHFIFTLIQDQFRKYTKEYAIARFFKPGYTSQYKKFNTTSH